MPIRTCTNCGNRTTLSDPNCPTCHYPLPSASPPAPLPPPATPGRAMPPVPYSPTTSGSPVPYGYGTTLPTSYTPTPTPAPMMAAPVVPAMTSYPSPPQLEGRVAYPPVQMENTLGAEWSHFVVGCLLFPLLILMPPLLIALLSRREKVPVTMVSIQPMSIGTGSSGYASLRSARVEGDLTTAGLNLGDQVALWGTDRGGTLIVNHGINHTMGGAMIRVRPRHIPVFTRAIAIILLSFVMLFVLASLLSHLH